MRADLHLHTSFSDGTFSPTALVELYARLGCDVMSVTDHDTVDGLPEAMEAAGKHPELTLIPGVEFSARFEDFDCHILGYGIDFTSAPIRNCLSYSAGLRHEKLSLRLAYLEERFGVALSEQAQARLYGRDSVGRLHIAKEMVAEGFGQSVEQALHTYLVGKDFPERAVDARRCIEAIKNAGGVAVFAHPLGGEGDRHIDLPLARSRILSLREAGVAGVECFYSRYTFLEEQGLVQIASELGMAVSAGSDFHGANKTVKPLELSSDGYFPDSEELTLLRRFGFGSKVRRA